MRVPRIYQNQPLQPFSRLSLDGQGSRHLISVLRFEKGHKVILFNGNGEEYPAEIIQTKKRFVEVQLKDKIIKDNESPLKLHLGQVITKGEKMDYLLQKATELGAIEFSPLFSMRSEVRLKGEREEKKHEHWLRVLQSACEQCGRNVIPTLNVANKLIDWTHLCSEETKLMLDHRSEMSLINVPLSHRIALLIGPEGGLTFEERMHAESKGFVGVHLGPRILRSETAGVAAIAILQGRIGDFNGSFTPAAL